VLHLEKRRRCLPSFKTGDIIQSTKSRICAMECSRVEQRANRLPPPSPWLLRPTALLYGDLRQRRKTRLPCPSWSRPFQHMRTPVISLRVAGADAEGGLAVNHLDKEIIWPEAREDPDAASPRLTQFPSLSICPFASPLLQA
jgi:hypothetical protein